MVVTEFALVVRGHFIKFPSLCPFLHLNVSPLMGTRSIPRLGSVAGARLLWRGCCQQLIIHPSRVASAAGSWVKSLLGMGSEVLLVFAIKWVRLPFSLWDLRNRTLDVYVWTVRHQDHGLGARSMARFLSSSMWVCFHKPSSLYRWTWTFTCPHNPAEIPPWWLTAFSVFATKSKSDELTAFLRSLPSNPVVNWHTGNKFRVFWLFWLSLY